jgi:TRAP-type C4-dicarboxylate transport system permease small subunit
MQIILERFSRWMHWLGALLTIAVMLVISYDVIARQFFNSPFSGAGELAATALVLIVFLQLPQSMLEKKLLRVTYFYDYSNSLGRSVLNVLAWFIGTVIFLALALTSWNPLVLAIQTGEFYGMDSFRIPAWPLRTGTFLLWITAALVCLFLTIESLSGRMTADEDQLPD